MTMDWILKHASCTALHTGEMGNVVIGIFYGSLVILMKN